VGLEKNSPLHSVNCDKQCRRRRTTDYRTYGTRVEATLRPSSIGSICHCICCNVGCI